MVQILQSLLRPPSKEYITAAEVACQSLKTAEADEFWADIARILKQARPTKPNLSKEEWKAIKELRSDKECLVLTADKGVALVVIDKKDYIQKVQKLLEDKKHLQVSEDGPHQQAKEQIDQHIEKYQVRRQTRRPCIQKDVPNWGKFTQTIWAT